jgi:hypothetical protein
LLFFFVAFVFFIFILFNLSKVAAWHYFNLESVNLKKEN